MTLIDTIGKNHRIFLAALLAGFILMGCTAATQRLHPRFKEYRHPMGAMLVLAPDIGIFEKMPDGSSIYQDTLSHDAREVAQQAITGQLQQRHFKVITADTDSLETDDIKAIASLFRSVNRSIQLHTIGPQVFPEKKSIFEYRLGSVAELLDTYGADGLVLALGHQTGLDRPDRNWFSIAVVEPQGRIIWYGIYGDHERFDIQSRTDLQALVASTMADFWESGS